MGRVRTKTVKRAARKIVENYYSKLTLDYHTNKRVIDEVTVIQTKRLRNRIAGYTTHLIARIQKAPVKGISLKLQEAEREKRMDYIPDKSILERDTIHLDYDSYAMAASVMEPHGENIKKLSGPQTKRAPVSS